MDDTNIPVEGGDDQEQIKTPVDGEEVAEGDTVVPEEEASEGVDNM